MRRQGLELYEGVPAKKASPALSPLLKDADRSLAAGAARILYQGGEKPMLEWLVLASFQAQGEEKLAYEKELETLQLADDRAQGHPAQGGNGEMMARSRAPRCVPAADAGAHRSRPRGLGGPDRPRSAPRS